MELKTAFPRAIALKIAFFVEGSIILLQVSQSKPANPHCAFRLPWDPIYGHSGGSVRFGACNLLAQMDFQFQLGSQDRGNTEKYLCKSM